MNQTDVIIRQVKCQNFTSNSFIIYGDNHSEACLVDIGDFDAVTGVLVKDCKINYLFLTHYHYDHIWGINQLLEKYPDCLIVTNDEGLAGLRSAKINLSFYHEEPVEYKGDNILLVQDNDEITIFDTFNILIFETPGHNPSCLSYKLGNHLFTGDSYIPGIKVVTKLKGGSIKESIISLNRLRALIDKDSFVYPGHGEIRRGADVVDDPILCSNSLSG